MEDPFVRGLRDAFQQTLTPSPVSLVPLFTLYFLVKGSLVPPRQADLAHMRHNLPKNAALVLSCLCLDLACSRDSSEARSNLYAH